MKVIIKYLSVGICLFLLILVSCQDNEEIYSGINLSNISTDYQPLLSDIVSESKYIKLETGDDFFVGNIQKVRIVDDKIFVLDMREAKALFVFDVEGSYLYTIGSHGKGAGEYLYPQDFEIDNDTIYMIADGRRVLKYKIDGTFIDQSRLNYNVEQIAIDKDKLVFLRVNHSGENVHLMNIYDKEFCFIREVYEAILPTCYIESYNYSFPYGKEVLYYSNFENKLIKINKNGEPEDALSFILPLDCQIEHARIKQILDKYPFPQNTQKVLSESVWILNFIHTSQFDYIKYRMRDECYIAIYDHESQLAKVASCSNFTNDIDSTGIDFYYCLRQDKENIIHVVYPEDIIDEFHDKSVTFQGYQVSINDNPIIVLYEVKTPA